MKAMCGHLGVYVMRYAPVDLLVAKYWQFDTQIIVSHLLGSDRKDTVCKLFGGPSGDLRIDE
jgi:hypothetical protein